MGAKCLRPKSDGASHFGQSASSTSSAPCGASRAVHVFSASYFGTISAGGENFLTPRRRSDAAQLQLKIPSDIDLDESRQQSGADHLLERLAITRIRRVGQKDDAPEVQRRLLRAANGMADMKERLEWTRR